MVKVIAIISIVASLSVGCTKDKEIFVPVPGHAQDPAPTPAPICEPDTVVLPQFKGLSAGEKVGRRSIRLTWQPIQEAIQYLVFKQQAEMMEVIKVLPRGTAEYIHENLGWGQHTYRVKAMNERGLLDGNTGDKTVLLEDFASYNNHQALFLNGLSNPQIAISGIQNDLKNEFTASFWMNLVKEKVGSLPISFPGDIGRTSFYVRLDKNKITVGHRRHNGHFSSFYALANYADSSWKNVTVSYDGKYFSLYLNGVFLGNQQDSFLGIGEGPIQLGSIAGKIGMVKGKMDEVALWSEALSAGQIKQLFGQGEAINLMDFSPRPLGWWRMGDGEVDGPKNIFDQASHFHIKAGSNEVFEFRDI